MAKTWACAALGILLLAALYSAGAQQPDGKTAPAAEFSAAPLIIGAGDLVDVAMFDAPELSGRFRVDEVGNIQMPLLGLVHVQGLTADQAGELLQNRYVEAEVLKPESSRATVIIEEYASQGITVTGQVRSPGVYPALGVRMLNDVITAAGGVAEAGSSNVIVTHRSDPQHPVTVEYNPEALEPEIPAVQVFPGDSIVVPRAGMVYIAGSVSKPGMYVLNGRDVLTVWRAMALAGGTGRAASVHRVQLVRKLADHRTEMVIIPVDRIFKGKYPDVALKDGDILYVPTSTGKLATEQAISSVLSIGTQVAVYSTALR